MKGSRGHLDCRRGPPSYSAADSHGSSRGGERERVEGERKAQDPRREVDKRWGWDVVAAR